MQRLKYDSDRDLITGKATFRSFAISKAFQCVVLIRRLVDHIGTLLETIN